MSNNSSVLAVTNPLHYTYFQAAGGNLAAVGSTHGLLADYARELGFGSNLALYDVANNIEAIVAADQAAGNSGRSYIGWKPVPGDHSYLGNSYDFAHPLECKATIRRLLPERLFPSFLIVPSGQISTTSYDEVIDQLAARQDGIVAQIDYSTGGKGTYFLQTPQQFEAVLPELIAAGQDIVFSRRIIGTSYGLQCFSDGQTVFSVDWWHDDLVGVDGVCAKDIPDATQYCGAILRNIPDKYIAAVRALVHEVGDVLLAKGYYGIFGLDIVVDDSSGVIHLIEINPRFTAVSHIYATAMRGVGYNTDFMTAHVAGLVGNDTLTAGNADLSRSIVLPGVYSYLKLQNLSGSAVLLSDDAKLGVYDARQEYSRFGFGIDSLQGAGEVVVIPEAARSVTRLHGERVYSIVAQGELVRAGQLATGWTEYIEALSKKLLVPEQGSGS